MSAVDRDGPVEIVVLSSGDTETMHYRRAVSLVSRGLAEFPKPKRKYRKREAAPEPVEPTLPDAAPEGQDVETAENKPHPLL